MQSLHVQCFMLIVKDNVIVKDCTRAVGAYCFLMVAPNFAKL